MARVTVEGLRPSVFRTASSWCCFAAQRARNLSRGEELTVDRDNDKNPSRGAARDRRGKRSALPKLEQDLIKSLSRAPEPEPADEEVLDLIPYRPEYLWVAGTCRPEEEAASPARRGYVSRGSRGQRSRLNSGGASAR